MQSYAELCIGLSLNVSGFKTFVWSTVNVEQTATSHGHFVCAAMRSLEKLKVDTTNRIKRSHRNVCF